MRMRRRQPGFTIVELLIVIVVIAILATISVVAYSGIQERARQAKIDSDLAMLEKAVHLARINTGNTMRIITGSNCTACECHSNPVSPDLAVLDKTSDGCWVAYLSAMNNISLASGMNVAHLVDPRGRPYYIDENEGEQQGTYGPCGMNKDFIGWFRLEEDGWWGDGEKFIDYMTPGCS